MVQFGLAWSSMWLRRKEVGFATGGRENVGTDVDGEKMEISSSVASGSGGSIGRYLLSTEAIL
jgi:hypothetical protein